MPFIFSNLISKIDKKVEKDLSNQLKNLTNTEEIKDFYEYTEICIKKLNLIKKPTEKEIEDLQKTIKFKDDIFHRKLAVFDLDETLVHSETKNQWKCDTIIEVNFPQGGKAKVIKLLI